MKHRLLLWLKILLAAIVLLYLCDEAAFLARRRRPTLFGTVQVNRFLSTPLKGEKYEYDFLGTETETCSHTLFPHASYTPCWWLARHATEWEH